MEMPHFSNEDSTLPMPPLQQHHEVPIPVQHHYHLIKYNLLIIPVRPATVVRPIPVASHTLSLMAPADAALGRRVGNEMMQSIWNFEFENGRRYHGYKAGSYPLPNDEVLATTHLSQMTHCTALSGV